MVHVHFDINSISSKTGSNEKNEPTVDVLFCKLTPHVSDRVSHQDLSRKFIICWETVRLYIQNYISDNEC